MTNFWHIRLLRLTYLQIRRRRVDMDRLAADITGRTEAGLDIYFYE